MSQEIFEYKTSGVGSSGPSKSSLSLDEAQGIVECFVAGIGNKDSVGDIVASGAFTKSLMRRKPRVVWGHSWNDPIGKVLEIYEVPTTDPRLPMKMKMAGIGGLFAKVQFNLNSEKGREAFANVAFFGEEQEWSIGYKTLRAQFDQKAQANVIYELELYEVSPVLHGANSLTGTISIKTDMLDSTDVYQLPQADREEMQKQLSMMYGPKTLILGADRENVTFARPGETGGMEKYKCGYARNGSTFMFSPPQRVVVPQESPSMPQMPSEQTPHPHRTVMRPQQMPAIPVAVKPNPIGPGTIMVPLPPVQYENENKPVDKNNLDKEEADLRDAIRKVVARHGRFNEDNTGVWAGYKPPENNPVAGIGVKCANCVFYKGGSSCEVISLPVHPEGKCRFAIIPDGVVKGDYGNKKSVEDDLLNDQENFVNELEAKYPGELLLAGLRGAVGRLKKKRRKKKYKDLAEFDELQIEEKGYCIPVEINDAFHVKNMLDPIMEYYGVESHVDVDGIIVKSGITYEFIDAVDTAIHNFQVKKKLLVDDVEVKNLGTRLASYGASRLIDRPRIGGGRSRGIGGFGVPEGDLNPDTRVDKNRNGWLFDNIPGWEQPDPTPYGPGSIYNRDITPQQSEDLRKIGPEGKPLTGAKPNDVAPLKAKPNEQRRLSSGRNMARHGLGKAHEQKFGVSRDEQKRREDFDKKVQLWIDSDMGWTEVGRQSTDKNASESLLRGRELGVNQARIAWRGTGKGNGKRPDSFNEKAKSSTDYANWYMAFSGHLGNFIKALNSTEKPNIPEHEKDYNAGIRQGIAEQVFAKMPNTASWEKKDSEKLNDWLKSYGFDPQKKNDGRLSSGLIHPEGPFSAPLNVGGKVTKLPGLDDDFDPDNPYGDDNSPYDLGFDVYDKIIEEFLGEEQPRKTGRPPIDDVSFADWSDKEIYEKRMGGMTLDEVATEMGIDRRDVRQRELRHMKKMREAEKLKKERAKTVRKARDNKRKLAKPSDEINEQIYEDRLNGMSESRAAKKYNLSKKEIRKRFNSVVEEKKKKETVLDSPKREISAEEQLKDKEIYDRRMAGASLADIADEMGTTREEVRRRELRHMHKERKTQKTRDEEGYLSSGRKPKPRNIAESNARGELSRTEGLTPNLRERYRQEENNDLTKIDWMPADVRGFLTQMMEKYEKVKITADDVELTPSMRERIRERGGKSENMVVALLRRARDGEMNPEHRRQIQNMLDDIEKKWQRQGGAMVDTARRDVSSNDRNAAARLGYILNEGNSSFKPIEGIDYRDIDKKRRERNTRLSSGINNEKLFKMGALGAAIESRLSSGKTKDKKVSADAQKGRINLTEADLKQTFDNIAAQILESIDKAIANPDAKWDRPWVDIDNYARNVTNTQVNPQGRAYEGVNQLILGMTSYANKWINKWAGPKQWKEIGGTVRPGEKPTAILAPTLDAQGKKIPNAFHVTWVYNVAQVDGLPKEMYLPARGQISDEQRIQDVEDIIRELSPEFVEGNFGGAFYSPNQDKIFMPPFSSFKDKESFYAVLLHELTHWTSHPSRLNRKLGRMSAPPGSELFEKYAFEELIAEIGSSLVMGMLGLEPEFRDDHGRYLAHWKQAILNNPNAIRNALEEAQKAVDYLLNRSATMRRMLGMPSRERKTDASLREQIPMLEGMPDSPKIPGSGLPKGTFEISDDGERLASGKIEDFASRPFKAGKTHNIGGRGWRAVDRENGDREVYHYSTQMGFIRKGKYYEVSEGWGSVSDKQGIRKILKALNQEKPLNAADAENIDRLASGKIDDLATRPFVRGKEMRVGSNRSWRSVDTQNGDREIHHYGTLMGFIRNGQFYQVSDGWGSVSDKQGINKILKALGQKEAIRMPRENDRPIDDDNLFPATPRINKNNDGVVVDSTGRLSSGGDSRSIQPKKGKKAKAVQKTNKNVSFVGAHGLRMEPSQQQRNIIDLAVDLVTKKNNSVVSVQAAAGTGKTSTLKMISTALNNLFNLDSARSEEELEDKLQYIQERFGVDFSGMSPSQIKKEVQKLKEKYAPGNMYYAVFNVSQQKKSELSFSGNTGVSTLDKMAFWGLRLGVADEVFGPHIARKMEISSAGHKRATRFDENGNPIRRKTSAKTKDGKPYVYKIKDYKTGKMKEFVGEKPTLEDSGLVQLTYGEDFVKYLGLRQRFHTPDRVEAGKKPIPTNDNAVLRRITHEDLGFILSRALSNWARSGDKELKAEHFILTELQIEQRRSARGEKRKTKRRFKKFGEKEKNEEKITGLEESGGVETEESDPLSDSDFFLEAAKDPEKAIPKEWVELGQQAVSAITDEYVKDPITGKKTLSMVAPDRDQQFKLFALSEPDLRTGKFLLGHAPNSTKLSNIKTNAQLGDYVDRTGNKIDIDKATPEQLEDIWVVTSLGSTNKKGMAVAKINKVYATPKNPLSSIMIDEAQDLNPIMMNILEKAKGTLPMILVGDSRQRIYGWRGAVDALKLIDPDFVLPLNESFRFGDRVAFLANIIQSLVNVDDEDMKVKDAIKQYVSGHYQDIVKQQFDRAIELLQLPQLPKKEQDELDDLLYIIDGDFRISSTLGPKNDGLDKNGDLISLAGKQLSNKEKLKVLQNNRDSAINEARGVIWDSEGIALDKKGNPIPLLNKEGKPLVDSQGNIVYQRNGPMLPQKGRSFAYLTRSNGEIFEAVVLYASAIASRLKTEEQELEKKLGRKLTAAEKFRPQITMSSNKYDELVGFFKHLNWAFASEKYKAMVPRPPMSPLIGNHWDMDSMWPLLGQSKYQQLTSMWDIMFKWDPEQGKFDITWPQDFLLELEGGFDRETGEMIAPTVIREREALTLDTNLGSEMLTPRNIKEIASRQNAKKQRREDGGRQENPSQLEAITIIPGKGKNQNISDVHAHLVIDGGDDKTPGKWNGKVHITGQGMTGQKKYPPSPDGKRVKPRAGGLYVEDVKRIMLTHPRLSKYFVFKENGGLVRRATDTGVRNDAWELDINHPDIAGNEELFSDLLRLATEEIRKAANTHGADARITTSALFKGDEAEDIVVGNSFIDAYMSIDQVKVKDKEVSESFREEMHNLYVTLTRPRKRIDPGPVVSQLYFGRENDDDETSKVGLNRRKKALDGLMREVERLEATGDPEDKALADAIRPPKDFVFPYQGESAKTRERKQKEKEKQERKEEKKKEKAREKEELKKLKELLDKENKKNEESGDNEPTEPIDENDEPTEEDEFGVDGIDDEDLEEQPNIDDVIDDSNMRLSSGTKNKNRRNRKAKKASGNNSKATKKEASEWSDEEIYNRRVNGMTLGEVSEAMGISRQEVRQRELRHQYAVGLKKKPRYVGPLGRRIEDPLDPEWDSNQFTAEELGMPDYMVNQTDENRLAEADEIDTLQSIADDAAEDAYIERQREERLSSGGRIARRIRRNQGQNNNGRLSSGKGVRTLAFSGFSDDPDDNEQAKRIWGMARKNGWLINTSIRDMEPEQQKRAIMQSLDKVQSRLSRRRESLKASGVNPNNVFSIRRMSENQIESANGDTWLVPVSKLKDMIRIPEEWNQDGQVRRSNPISNTQLAKLLGITSPKELNAMKEDDAGIPFNAIMYLISELGNEPELTSWALFSPTTPDEASYASMKPIDRLAENVARSKMRERFMLETFGRDAYPTFELNGRRITQEEYDRLDDDEKFDANGAWPQLFTEGFDDNFNDANGSLMVEGAYGMLDAIQPERIKTKPEEAKPISQAAVKTSKLDFSVDELLESLGIDPQDKGWAKKLQEIIDKASKNKPKDKRINVLGEKTPGRWKNNGVPVAVISEMIRLGIIKDAKSVFKSNDSGSRLDDELKSIQYAVYEALNNFLNARHGDSNLNTGQTLKEILGYTDAHLYIKKAASAKGDLFNPGKGDEPRFTRERLQDVVNRFNNIFGTEYTIDDIFSDEQLRSAKEKIESGEYTPIGKKSNRTVLVDKENKEKP